jgi:hypothetical protein
VPFDPSGNFTRVHRWQDDRDNGIRILADRHDEEDDNFAEAFNQVFLRTGTTPMVGDLVMNGNKITMLGAGTETVPSLTWELSNNTGWWQPSPNALAVSTQGTKRLEVNNTGIAVYGGISNVGDLTVDGDTTVSGNITVTGDANVAGGLGVSGAAVIGGTQINDNGAIELGIERTADGITILDFHSTVGTDYDARIMRGAGPNGGMFIINKGAASLVLHSETAGGNVIIQTVGANRFAVWDNGDAQFYNNVAIAGLLNVTGNIGTPGTVVSSTIATDALYLPRASGGLYQGLMYADQGSVVISSGRNNPGAERFFTFGADGQIYTSGGIVWGAYNDGAGSGLDADFLDGYQAAAFQPSLGFFPVQQGGGAFQLTNKVAIGWDGLKLRAQVDTSDLGQFAFLHGAQVFDSTVEAASFSGNTCNGYDYVWGNNQIITNGTITASSAINSQGTAGAGFQFAARDNSNLAHLWYGQANFAHLWRNDQGDIFEFHPTAFRTPGDQVADCGGPSQRWFTVWCRTSAMATSDLREKDWRGGLNDTELEVAKALAKEIGIYRWLSDIEKDGDGAKLSCGFAAQHVIALFEKHGLNALDYAFIRYDEWEERTSKGPPIGDCPEPKCIDEELGIYDYTDDREMEVICHPAGNRYSIMLADLLAFMMVGQEQRLAALEARL